MANPNEEALTLLATATEVAVLGSRLAAARASDRRPEQKDETGNVVTATDRAVEKAIKARLGELRPDDRVIGEELDDSGTGLSRVEWYIDPIDGTSNYVLSFDYYCTSIAAYDTSAGSWLVAAIAADQLDVVYTAVAGAGSWKATPTGRERLLATGPRGAPRLLGYGVSYDPSMRGQQLSDLVREMAGFDDLRMLGSAALALCFVAEGSLTAFVESDLYVHDWAAGALIAAEAGALVSTPGLQRGGVRACGRDAPAHMLRMGNCAQAR
jgi:myo-inositol-1(or 4)-monophosphatase